MPLLRKRIFWAVPGLLIVCLGSYMLVGNLNRSDLAISYLTFRNFSYGLGQSFSPSEFEIVCKPRYEDVNITGLPPSVTWGGPTQTSTKNHGATSQMTFFYISKSGEAAIRLDLCFIEQQLPGKGLLEVSMPFEPWGVPQAILEQYQLAMPTYQHWSMHFENMLITVLVLPNANGDLPYPNPKVLAFISELQAFVDSHLVKR